jgi:MFS family permease
MYIKHNPSFFMQVTGLGALIVTPLVGNLSDKYGRKALLTLPTTITILPLGTAGKNYVLSDFWQLNTFIFLVSSNLYPKDKYAQSKL